MRHQGKITEWRDEKGFGFVSPNGGGPRVFVHVSEFSNRRRRPVVDALVTYELSTDSRGRPRGVKVAFVSDGPVSAASSAAAAPGPGPLALGLAFGFVALLGVAVAVGRLPFPVLLAYLGMSSVAYLAYAFDKAAALRGHWRTAEVSLHLLGLLGGWPGALVAQRSFRHKTRKRSFRVEFWITVLLNCAALGWLLHAR